MRKMRENGEKFKVINKSPFSPAKIHSLSLTLNLELFQKHFLGRNEAKG